MTERLYYTSPDLREFSATVVERIEKDGRHAIVLERTAFYPTGGGQPHDTGTLDGVPVVDVVEEAGKILHFVERPIPGEQVRGIVDWDRRVDHLQQHHGQHLLSAAFVQVANAETTSFHLGPEVCSIDLTRNDLSENEIAEAQKLANRVIFENRPVTIDWFDPDEARRLPLRKEAAGFAGGKVRVVQVEGFDMQACCGTHPASTGPVGLVCVLHHERSKEGTRVYFVCGGRVAVEASRLSRQARALAGKISAPVHELEKTLDRRLAEERELRRRLGDRDKELARFRAREIFGRAAESNGRRICSAEVVGAEIKDLKTLAHELLKNPSTLVALVSPSAAGVAFVAAASVNLAVDLRPTLKALLARFGGKGGGEAKFVQGNFQPGNASAIRDALLQAMQAL